MVLIDMEKPRECWECPFLTVGNNCRFYPEDDQPDTFDEQYALCPLKEVQE